MPRAPGSAEWQGQNSKFGTVARSAKRQVSQRASQWDWLAGAWAAWPAGLGELGLAGWLSLGGWGWA